MYVSLGSGGRVGLSLGATPAVRPFQQHVAVRSIDDVERRASSHVRRQIVTRRRRTRYGGVVDSKHGLVGVDLGTFQRSQMYTAVCHDGTRLEMTLVVRFGEIREESCLEL